jgi:hypothetical protein
VLRGALGALLCRPFTKFRIAASFEAMALGLIEGDLTLLDLLGL